MEALWKFSYQDAMLQFFEEKDLKEMQELLSVSCLQRNG
jgi:hypothetical protein